MIILLYEQTAAIVKVTYGAFYNVCCTKQLI